MRIPVHSRGSESAAGRARSPPARRRGRDRLGVFMFMILCTICGYLAVSLLYTFVIGLITRWFQVLLGPPALLVSLAISVFFNIPSLGATYTSPYCRPSGASSTTSGLVHRPSTPSAAFCTSGARVSSPTCSGSSPGPLGSLFSSPCRSTASARPSGNGWSSPVPSRRRRRASPVNCETACCSHRAKR